MGFARFYSRPRANWHRRDLPDLLVSDPGHPDNFPAEGGPNKGTTCKWGPGRSVFWRYGAAKLHPCDQLPTNEQTVAKGRSPITRQTRNHGNMVDSSFLGFQGGFITGNVYKKGGVGQRKTRIHLPLGPKNRRKPTRALGVA